jgi:hypothetical protein
MKIEDLQVTAQLAHLNMGEKELAAVTHKKEGWMMNGGFRPKRLAVKRLLGGAFTKRLPWVLKFRAQ